MKLYDTEEMGAASDHEDSLHLDFGKQSRGKILLERKVSQYHDDSEVIPQSPSIFNNLRSPTKLWHCLGEMDTLNSRQKRLQSEDCIEEVNASVMDMTNCSGSESGDRPQHSDDVSNFTAKMSFNAPTGSQKEESPHDATLTFEEVRLLS